MFYDKHEGVPSFECTEFEGKKRDYVILIPIINEGPRIKNQLKRAQVAQIKNCADIAICDGGSTDGGTDQSLLKSLGVNTLMEKKSEGKQGAQYRMGIWWALERGYKGIITIDGNDKDSIEDVPKFIEKLEEGYDYVQGSRFIKGGYSLNTPLTRLIAIRLIHAPVISKTAGQKFTDSTNGFRAYSSAYLKDERVQPLRDVFMTYELLAYLSVRASQIGMRACEIPVSRIYPKSGKVPSKISFFKGNGNLMKILWNNAKGAYNP